MKDSEKAAIIGGIAVAGIAAYLLLKKTTTTPPPTTVYTTSSTTSPSPNQIFVQFVNLTNYTITVSNSTTTINIPAKKMGAAWITPGVYTITYVGLNYSYTAPITTSTTIYFNLPSSSGTVLVTFNNTTQYSVWVSGNGQQINLAPYAFITVNVSPGTYQVYFPSLLEGYTVNITQSGTVNITTANATKSPPPSF